MWRQKRIHSKPRLDVDSIMFAINSRQSRKRSTPNSNIYTARVVAVLPVAVVYNLRQDELGREMSVSCDINRLISISMMDFRLVILGNRRSCIRTSTFCS